MTRQDAIITPAPMNPTANFPGLQLPLLGQTVIEAEAQPPTALFAQPLRYPESLNDYMPTAGGNSLESLPRPLLVLEEPNDLLRTLGRSAGEFVQAAANFARIGRKWGITALVSALGWTAKQVSQVRNQFPELPPKSA